jgi:hypothetical protein
MPPLKKSYSLVSDSDVLFTTNQAGTVSGIQLPVSGISFLRSFFVEIIDPFRFGYLGVFNSQGNEVFSLDSNQLNNPINFNIPVNKLITEDTSYYLASYSESLSRFSVSIKGQKVSDKDIFSVSKVLSLSINPEGYGYFRKIEIKKRLKMIGVTAKSSAVKPTWKSAGKLIVFGMAIETQESYELDSRKVILNADIQSFVFPSPMWISHVIFVPSFWINSIQLDLYLGI